MNADHFEKELLEILVGDDPKKSEGAKLSLWQAFIELKACKETRNALAAVKNDEVPNDYALIDLKRPDLKNCVKAAKALSRAIDHLKNIRPDLSLHKGSQKPLRGLISSVSVDMIILSNRLNEIADTVDVIKGAPKKNTDLENAIWTLANAYELYTGGKLSKGSEDLTFDIPEGTYTGPFMRFCETALKASRTEELEKGLRDVIKIALAKRNLHLSSLQDK